MMLALPLAILALLGGVEPLKFSKTVTTTSSGVSAGGQGLISGTDYQQEAGYYPGQQQIASGEAYYGPQAGLSAGAYYSSAGYSQAQGPGYAAAYLSEQQQYPLHGAAGELEPEYAAAGQQVSQVQLGGTKGISVASEAGSQLDNWRGYQQQQQPQSYYRAPLQQISYAPAYVQQQPQALAYVIIKPIQHPLYSSRYYETPRYSSLLHVKGSSYGPAPAYQQQSYAPAYQQQSYAPAYQQQSYAAPLVQSHLASSGSTKGGVYFAGAEQGLVQRQQQQLIRQNEPRPQAQIQGAYVQQTTTTVEKGSKLNKIKSSIDKLAASAKAKLTLGSSYQVTGEELVGPVVAAPVPVPVVQLLPQSYLVQQHQHQQQQQLAQGQQLDSDLALTKQEQEKIQENLQKEEQFQQQQQQQQDKYSEAERAKGQEEEKQGQQQLLAAGEQAKQQQQQQVEEQSSSSDGFGRRYQRLVGRASQALHSHAAAHSQQVELDAAKAAAKAI